MAAVMAGLAEDIAWTSLGDGAPWCGSWRGREGVAGYFAAVTGVCAIAGYPADECGAEVSDADASAAASAAANENPNPADTTSQDSDESSSTNAGAFALGAAALAALIAAAFLIPARRRRNRATEDEGQV